MFLLCLERLFLYFAQFGGNFLGLNLAKIRDINSFKSNMQAKYQEFIDPLLLVLLLVVLLD